MGGEAFPGKGQANLLLTYAPASHVLWAPQSGSKGTPMNGYSTGCFYLHAPVKGIRVLRKRNKSPQTGV